MQAEFWKKCFKRAIRVNFYFSCTHYFYDTFIFLFPETEAMQNNKDVSEPTVYTYLAHRFARQ